MFLKQFYYLSSTIFKEVRFPERSKINIFGLLILLTSFISTIEAQKYVSYKKRYDDKPLVDFLHRKSLDMSKYYKITDIPINIYILLILLKFNKKVHLFTISLAVTYFLRLLSFSMTVLPKCGKMKDKDSTRSSLHILKDYLSLKDTHIGHNNDLLPSGHVCFSNIFYLYISRNKNASPLFKKIVLYTNIINSIFIILSRCHYSVDVFYGYILSYLVYSNLETPLLKIA